MNPDHITVPKTLHAMFGSEGSEEGKRGDEKWGREKRWEKGKR